MHVTDSRDPLTTCSPLSNVLFCRPLRQVAKLEADWRAAETRDRVSQCLGQHLQRQHGNFWSRPASCRTLAWRMAPQLAFVWSSASFL